MSVVLHSNQGQVCMSVAATSQEHVGGGDFDQISERLTNDFNDRIIAEEMLA